MIEAIVNLNSFIDLAPLMSGNSGFSDYKLIYINDAVAFLPSLTQFFLGKKCLLSDFCLVPDINYLCSFDLLLSDLELLIYPSQVVDSELPLREASVELQASFF